MLSKYRIDLRQVDELAAHDRQMQMEDRERRAGLKVAALFSVFSIIGAVMAFGLLCAWIFHVNG